MNTLEQNQTVTVKQNVNELDQQTIDSKFMEIKNRLKEQHEGSIKKSKFQSEFQMEQTSEFDQNNDDKLNETHHNQALQKLDIKQKKVLSEINGNIQATQSEYEYSVIDDGINEKENKKILPSYQSSLRNIHGSLKKVDIQKASENDPYSAMMRESDYSKISQTFVVKPRKDEKQTSPDYKKVESDLQGKINFPLQIIETVSVNDSRIEQSNREQNSTKYNYMNEQLPSFKDLLESNQNYSDVASSHCEAYQLVQKFQQVLNSQDVSQLNVEDKKEYINYLRKEIIIEQKKETQYKQMQEEAAQLNKNYKLEKELYQTEQDNRKLQIWILEDKKKQIESEYEVKLKEKTDFEQQLQDLYQKKDQTNQKQNQINQLINSTHSELENLKKYQNQGFDQKDSFLIEQQKLKSELQGEQQLLNQILQNNQNITKIFDQNSLKVQKYLKMIQEYQNALQYKETSIFGFRKEIKRIEEDIIEANQIKGTIKEEKDMFETQLSFLQKQKNILERDIENLKKKKKFEEEFIHYGDKNNHQLFDVIKQNKHFFDKFQMDNQMKIKENKLIGQKNEMIQNKIQQSQILISQIEQNINQIIEVTQFQDELFKDQNRFHETKAILMRLCKRNFSQDQNKIAEEQNSVSSSTASVNQKSFVKEQQKNVEKMNEIRQKQKFNLQNVYEIFSASLNRKNTSQDEDLNLEEQPTKRVLSEKCTSPTEGKSGNSIGFMGLGKNFNQQAKNNNRCMSQDEFDEIEQGVNNEEPALVNQNDLKSKLSLKNLDKISKITDQQKLQSPFTVRSILGTQNENADEYKSSNRYKVNQKELPPSKCSLSNKQQKTKQADLKSFLTGKSNENLQKQNLNQQQERLQNMVNQIRSCSPLKQVNQPIPNKIFSEKELNPSASKSNFSNKNSINSKSQDKNQEMIKYLEIQKKNELIKKGQIKQMIYINDSVIEQQPVQKILKKKKVFIKSMATQDFQYFDYPQNYQENAYAQNPSNYVQQNDENQMQFIKQSKSQTQEQSLRKKSVKKQFKTMQDQQNDLIQIEDYQREFPEFQIVNQDEDNIIFAKSQQFSRKNFQNQQALFGQRAQPFRKRSVSPAKVSDQSNERPVFAQAVKMTILKGFVGEEIDSKYDQNVYPVDYRNTSKKDSLKNPQFFQRNPYSRDVSREKNQILEYDQKTLNKKNGATASKQDLNRFNYPLNYFNENQNFKNGSLVETQYHNVNKNSSWNKVKVAPLRKSTSQRREEQIIYEQKSETQSQMYQLSSIQSATLQNRDNKHNIINKRFDQISVQSQQVADIPPIPGKILKAQKRYEQEINSNEINILAVQNINREIEQSQKTTRTQYVVGNKNQLTQKGYIQENFNDNVQIYQNLPPKNKYDVEQSQQSQNHNQSQQLTFEKSKNSHHGHMISNDTFAQRQFDLNLRSNFAKKTLEQSGADKKNLSRDKFSPINSKIDRQLHPCSIIDQDSHTNTSYQFNQDSKRFNAVPQSVQSIQNNSIYGEIQNKQVQSFYQQPKNFDSINQVAYNKDQIFQLQSPAHNSKNNSNTQLFTPFYKNNYNLSGIKNDQIQSDSVNKYAGQQLQLKSNFAKNKFDNYKVSQTKQVFNDFIQDGPQQFQKNLQIKTLQSSPSTKMSIYPNQIAQINEDCIQNENRSQNQNKLSKMQQELQILKSQISDGIKPCYTQSLIEPGNQEAKNNFLQNENCFSDLYIEQINLNSDRLDEMAPIDYQMKDNQINDALKQNLNTVSSQTLHTQMTKPIMDTYYINQEKNIKVSLHSGDFRNELMNEDGQQLTKFRQIKDDLNIEDRISEYENESVNTYVSLKDQSDIISQLRSCKPTKKY